MTIGSDIILHKYMTGILPVGTDGGAFVGNAAELVKYADKKHVIEIYDSVGRVNVGILGNVGYEPETLTYFQLPGASGDIDVINTAIWNIKYGTGLTLDTVSLNISAATNLFLTRAQYTSTGLPTNDFRWIPQGTTKITLNDGTNSATMRAVSAGSAETLGSNLVVGWDFTSGWLTDSGVTINNSTQFVSTGNGGVKKDLMTLNRLYKSKLAGSTSSAGITLTNSAFSTTYASANLANYSYQTAVTDTNLRIRNSGAGTTTVTLLESWPVTAPDASGIVFDNLTLGSLNVNAASYSVKLEKW
jgi:hypothetical protein